MYYKPDTGQIFNSHSDIRSNVDNVLFPGVMDDDMLAYNGIYPLVYIKPQLTPTQTAEPYGVEMVDGQWTQQWTIRDSTPEEIEAEKPQVPFSVTRRQARQALAIRGLLDSIEAAIDALDDGTPEGKQKALLVKIEWQDSLNFERHRPLVISIGNAVGLDDNGLDNLFRFASTL